jgi:hypothetical protein
VTSSSFEYNNGIIFMFKCTLQEGLISALESACSVKND